MSKHDKQPKPQKAAKPDPNHPEAFPGSTFAPVVPDGKQAHVAGYVTEPDAHGAARYSAVEDYYNDRSVFPHGPPADACHKFISEGSLAAFHVSVDQAAQISFNTGSATLFAGIGYGADRLTAQYCHLLGSPHNAKILSDTLAFAGTGKDGTPAVEPAEAVAEWRKTGWHPRTPFANATDAPAPIGGGL
jgi:hypothetical protein